MGARIFKTMTVSSIKTFQIMNKYMRIVPKISFEISTLEEKFKVFEL
jgi:hypothetical protein